ncbi:hypothetical protein CALVIDRAFT_491979 [Calocera viscosa TUFC12733]|uniref:Uncharacterized protein n=1 Tax=Calocera viscosa (strain TUFC12733) TaxID=1330018 RepID=A0A167S0W3_CALVF|nr:hypothetical protein CALVIDRAFT_491979 [Calocera viscosa TUFC12733]
MRSARKGTEPKVSKPLDLPRASFRKIEDEASTKPLGVHDLQARSYGYNNFDDWERPDYYIRYIEPIESELAVQVEYDMDEQDQEWLDALNKERKDLGMDQVSYETFEIIMDKLEKEWFDLMKRVPKPQTDAPPEDSTCAVCDDGEGENSNAIVFCDGCNLAVHQECYGIPYIPEGQWLCRKCTISPENPVSCVLCPAEAGAFKQTNTTKWVHLLCALWNPEVTVTKGAYMEPIEGIERISKPRWRLVCSICGIKKGACIQCQKASCATAFHVTCARQEGLLGSMKSFAEEEHSLRVFCEKHLPPDMLKNRRIHTPPPASSSGAATLKSTKAALAHSSGYAPPAPVIPVYVYERVRAYISKIRLLKKREFLALVCKYWSLKREARRGAPLLKRLHLEPWTASSSNRHKTEEQKERQLKFLATLRGDIERIRIMAEYVVRRERKKMDRIEELQATIGSILFPFENTLHDALDQIAAVDKMKHFHEPVDRAEVPDYYDVVKNPMDWTQMKEKIQKHEYMNIEEFQNDVNLVFDNAMLYNAPNSTYYKGAVKCKLACEPILAELKAVEEGDVTIDGHLDPNANPVPIPTVNGISHPTAASSPKEGDVAGIPPRLRRVNNLEPSFAALEVLDAPNAIDAQDLDFKLSGSALEFLYFYGVTELKPPPTPPPPAPKVPRDRAAERQRKLEERERAAAEKDELLRQAVLLPRTRRGKKIADSMQLDGSKADTPLPEVEQPAGPEVAAVADHGTTEQTSSSVLEEAQGGAEKPKKRKRGTSALPGVPLFVMDTNEMTSHGQFRHFDTGWVLDSRTRSGNRSGAPATPTPGPSRKRGRQSEGVVTSSARPLKRRKPNARSTPLREPDVIQETQQDHLFSSDVSDVTESDVEADEDMDKKEEEQEVSPELTREPPAPHQSRNSIPPAPEHSREAAASKQRGGRKPIVSGMYGRSRQKPPVVKENEIDEETAEQVFQEGTLVWAKQNSYPWFPAEISVLNGPELREDIAGAKPVMDKKFENKRLWFVRFFGKSRTWAWLPATRMYLLGEDTEFDARLLHEKQFKSAHMKQSVRHAYKAARELMQPPEDTAKEDALQARIAAGDKEAKKEYEALHGSGGEDDSENGDSMDVDGEAGLSMAVDDAE